jgi:DNA-binding NtrC family response regulator
MKVLVIDDDTALADLLVQRLEKWGHTALAVYRGDVAVREIVQISPDMVLCDYALADTTGLTLLPQLRSLHPRSPVVMMTGSGSSKLAVQCMRAGAEDYIEKPMDFEELQIVISRIESAMRTRLELEEVKGHRRDEAVRELNLVSRESMQDIYEDIERVASASRITVLVCGETGTGKEHVAKLLHLLSDRGTRPFVEFNCAALPENLAESELFGFEAGSFTDAKKLKKGLLESANGGTVFFDEVGELSLSIQAKLLKVLEDREFRRLGSLSASPLDIRVVAATNRDLSQEVQAGRFRADLYYRLNVYSLRIPPLRERPSDIRNLASFFFNKACSEFGRKLRPMDQALLKSLESHPWPGNVRELRNVIDGLVIRSRGDALELEDLKRSLGQAAPASPSQAEEAVDVAVPASMDGDFPGLKEVLDRSSRGMKRRMIEMALEKSGGNKSEAAKMLKVDYKTLYNLIKELEINPKLSFGAEDAQAGAPKP